jgi:hypothetical protein
MSRSDDRYGLLMKLQNLLQTLGFSSIVVMVDRLDEPHLINGSAERIRDFLWPMFDNKFLKHPGLAFKMLLPSAVAHYLDRQEKEFYDRSRLDKQNLVPALEWSGEALYDIANDRIRACAKLADSTPSMQDLFDDSVGREVDLNLLPAAGAPASVQVHPPPARRSLQQVHGGSAVVEDQPRYAATVTGAVPQGPLRLRTRPRDRLIAVKSNRRTLNVERERPSPGFPIRCLSCRRINHR